MLSSFDAVGELGAAMSRGIDEKASSETSLPQLGLEGSGSRSQDADQALVRTPSDAVGEPARNGPSTSFLDRLRRSDELRLKHKPFLGDKLDAAETLKGWKVRGDVIV